MRKLGRQTSGSSLCKRLVPEAKPHVALLIVSLWEELIWQVLTVLSISILSRLNVPALTHLLLQTLLLTWQWAALSDASAICWRCRGLTDTR